MAEQKSDQEKTEEPTARKLEKAREDGNVSISKEISSLMVLVASMFSFIAIGKTVSMTMQGEFRRLFIQSASLIDTTEEASSVFQDTLLTGFNMLLPFLGILMITALFVNLAQTGGLFSVKALQPKPNKMNPISGIKKIISVKGLAELLKGLLKLAIVGFIAYWAISSNLPFFVSFIIEPLEYTLGQIGAHVILFIGQILGALFILSIADAAFQRFQHRKELRMTKQEVKDEFKEMEGDPRLKSQRRQFGLKLRRKPRLDHSVLAADVVITNPTHYAVCLAYDPEINDAPRVLVKGQRLRALRIKELAKEYGTPIVENKPVARALFATAEEGETIPNDLFKAVAEILAYVYKQKNRV